MTKAAACALYRHTYPRRLPHDEDLFGVAAESVDVLLGPGHGGALVLDPVVTGAAVHGIAGSDQVRGKKAENVEPV